MPPQHEKDTLTPASSDSIGSFLSLNPDQRDDLVSRLSPDAKQALLLGLRTMSQAKRYGSTTPTTTPEVAPSTGKAGTVYRPTGAFVREPTIGGATEEPGQTILKTGQEMIPPGKAIGAGVMMAAAPEASLPIEIMLGMIGGASGEAGEQLLRRATGLGEQPSEDASERGLDITKAGLEMGAFQGALGGASRVADAFSKYINPYIFGTEGVFRAAGPPADPEFFDNVQASSWDLANIYKQTEQQIRDKRGGFLNADHRFDAVVNGIKNYKEQMYENERAAQIAIGKNYGKRVTVPGNPNELEFMGNWLSRQLPMGDPSPTAPVEKQRQFLALRAAKALAKNPLAPIPIEEADALAVAVNGYDLKKAYDRATSKVLSGKNAVDQGLKRSINDTLRSIGQPGIASYERRYAALSRVEEALASKMNHVQAMRTSDRLRAFFSVHGLYARGSVESLESPGRRLEDALAALERAQRRGTIPQPGSSTAAPYRIFEGEIVPPGEEMTTTLPRAGEPSGGDVGGAGGMRPPPKMITIPPPGEPRLLPERTMERRAPTGTGYESPHPEYNVSPPGSIAREQIDRLEKAGDVAGLRRTYEVANQVGDAQDMNYARKALQRLGAERRTIPFAGVQGPNPMRMAVMKDIQDNINLLEKDDPIRKVLQNRLDDMKAHPFESAESELSGETDISRIKAKGKPTMSREEAEAETKKRAQARKSRFTPPPKPKDEPNF